MAEGRKPTGCLFGFMLDTKQPGSTRLVLIAHDYPYFRAWRTAAPGFVECSGGALGTGPAPLQRILNYLSGWTQIFRESGKHFRGDRNSPALK